MHGSCRRHSEGVLRRSDGRENPRSSDGNTTFRRQFDKRRNFVAQRVKMEVESQKGDHFSEVMSATMFAEQDAAAIRSDSNVSFQAAGAGAGPDRQIRWSGRATVARSNGGGGDLSTATKDDFRRRRRRSDIDSGSPRTVDTARTRGVGTANAYYSVYTASNKVDMPASKVDTVANKVYSTANKVDSTASRTSAGNNHRHRNSRRAFAAANNVDSPSRIRSFRNTPNVDAPLLRRAVDLAELVQRSAAVRRRIRRLCTTVGHSMLYSAP